ncbi:phosphotriesterase [Aquimarina sp. BL5]|uniref:Imm26 family immunity protein n=1 Tax=Aquimarina sp. BL5 TaxID=1714860 RepID=UPI000E4912FD|nr:Imm26 family immunity protein [Aquimarina sp. BL5]AXT53792.1 phosphotriesterase [Aquimarina sp. BL5]RKM96263.1 phosphotriesterase [Aquimarina sp. BL5]
MAKQKKIKLEKGDILSIDLDNNEYAFARVLSKLSIGHCIEIFDHIGSKPDDYKNINFGSRLLQPQIIDSHSLFWLGKEGNWNVLEKHEDYTPPSNENTKFEYGDESNPTLIDIFGNKEEKSNSDENRYPPYIPKGDIQIKKIIKFWRAKTAPS